MRDAPAAANDDATTWGEAARPHHPLRILHVNKFLYRRGGAEAYLFDVMDLQRAAGHEVELFGMQDDRNVPCRYASWFPSAVVLNPVPTTAKGRLRGVGRMLWSPEVARAMARVLDDFRPDVVHVHNIYHQLSPSLLVPVVRRGIACVMTLHDYKLACPSYLFLDHGRVCEDCLGGRFHRAVARRCQDGSLGASVAVAAESYIHRAVGAYDGIDAFICPSQFMAAKMRDANVYPERMHVLPHFAPLSTAPRDTSPGIGARERIVYAGRLSDEKGVDVVVRAMARVGGLELDVAGEGPALARLTGLADRHAPGRVHFHGRLEKARVVTLMREALAVVVPSRCYENQPLTVLESHALGVPVVGSDLGGISELVRDGVSGLLVPPGDVDAMARALASLRDDPAHARILGDAGRRAVEHNHSPGLHLRQLDALYRSLVQARAVAS